MIVRRSELAGTAVAGNDKAALVILLDQAGAHELPHQAGSIVADFVVVLQFGDLLLHGVELGQLCLSVGLLLSLSLLVGLDLLESTAPFRRYLEHVRAHALGHYHEGRGSAIYG